MRIGIDLGGTKIEGLVLDKGGVERERLRVPTPAGSYEEDVEAIVDLIAGLERKAGQRCTVGIAHPGAISPASGLIKNANSTRLNGRPLKADLERRLGREVRLANDANCFAVSEASDGAAAGCGIVFGVILGTGVGGGVVIDGRPLTGAQAIAGEWGHNPLPQPGDGERPGPHCYCGRRGCIETWLSGPRLQQQFEERTGRTLRATDIAAAALAGDAEAAQHMELYCDRLARALAGDHQHPRPARHRAGRRPLAHEPALRPRARAVEALRLLRARPHRDPAAAAQARRFERRARRCVAVAGVISHLISSPRGA